ncbi:hypothetical protein BpHYR1_022579 [Brachionus plicatilis]|uniref:Uncharacterized protein n=1 Tax=Brachionus plicatilis TaxID=10195 RepID=A0A3M7RY77_BRAPC|nr:hypothetical protein BpHYR1_022579 [Brachionus plicatilis]
MIIQKIRIIIIGGYRLSVIGFIINFGKIVKLTPSVLRDLNSKSV